MDNGLIFPYRQSSAHDEPGDANHPKLIGTEPFGARPVSVAWDPNW